ncbi:MAG: hypothetical protein RLN69_02185, partial [Woeseiaceae bacterium]
GMRAPEFAEFAAAAERLIPGRMLPVTDHDGNKVFYTDPDLDASESLPGSIAERSLQRARQRFDSACQFSFDEFTEIFGSMVTDPKAWLEPEQLGKPAVRRIRAQLGAQARLAVHGMARIAFAAPGEIDAKLCWVFANGFSRQCSPAVVPQIAHLCAHRGLDRTDIEIWQSDRELGEILDWLLACGAFDAGAG